MKRQNPPQPMTPQEKARRADGWLSGGFETTELKLVGDEPGYQAYIVGPDGHFVGAEGFFAPNDEAAYEYARQFVDGHDVELWSGNRYVAKLLKDETRE